MYFNNNEVQQTENDPHLSARDCKKITPPFLMSLYGLSNYIYKAAAVLNTVLNYSLQRQEQKCMKFYSK